MQEGYLKAMQYSFFRKKEEDDEGRKEDETTCAPSFLAALSQLQKGSELNLLGLSIKEGNLSAKTLHLRFDDPCNGKCRTAH